MRRLGGALSGDDVTLGRVLLSNSNADQMVSAWPALGASWADLASAGPMGRREGFEPPTSGSKPDALSFPALDRRMRNTSNPFSFRRADAGFRGNATSNVNI